MPQQSNSWTLATQERIAEVQAARRTIEEWARDGKATPEQAEMLLKPHHELLEALRERDLPLADLADSLSTPPTR